MLWCLIFITTAKALGGGIMPIGAFAAQPKVWGKFIEPLK